MIFTRGSHHWNMSIVFVTQHMFTKEIRIARNNAHYLVCLRNPAGQLQLRNLAAQIYPGQVGFMLNAYKSATENNYGYLVIDLHPASSEILRLRTNIFPPHFPVIFVPK